MFNPEQVAQTERRYAARAEARGRAEAKIAAGEILEANDPEHVRLRLERKGVESKVVERALRGDIGPMPAPALEGLAPAAAIGLERIIGKSDLIEANFLQAGARSARCVCRIVIGDGGDLVAGYGTGVLVSPRLLLTNNHVLESPRWAAGSTAEFDYEDDEDGRPRPVVRFALDPDAFFVTDPDIDYTLTAVRPESADGRRLHDYGWAALIVEPGKVIKGECVNIIQHPNGEPKQVALRANQVVDLLPDFLHYRTDTAPGSSGAPVFNDEWELVALHHSGVPARDADGNILAIGGAVWTTDMGDHRVSWIANEGARVSRIVGHVRDQNLDPAQRRLVAEALDGQPGSTAPLRIGGTIPAEPVRTRPDTTSDPGEVTGAAPGDSDSDLAVTWTIPLQVSVRLGRPVTDAPRPPAAIADAGADASNRQPRGTDTDLGDGALAEALAELERGRSRAYYDCATDEADRDRYYTDLPKRRGGPSFFSALGGLLRESHQRQPRYAPSRYVYPWVDLQPNGMLRSLYTGDEYDPEEFIREDFRVERDRASRLRERLAAESTIGTLDLAEAIDLLEALLPYNCEHVVPQSWFDKREPMRGDLHHLFACEGRCNSFRRNSSYFEFPQFDEAVRQGCGMADGNRFEPVHGKGPAARATLYFLIRYPGEINRTTRELEADRLPMLLEWHRGEPVEDYERHRNAAIFTMQGNRNPLIDFPKWADEIDFESGLGESTGLKPRAQPTKSLRD